MDAGKLLVATSCISAFVAALLLAVLAQSEFRARSRVVRLQQRTGQEGGMRFMYTGIAGFAKLAEKLLAYQPVQRYCQSLCFACEYKGIAAQQRGVLSALLAVCCLCCGVCIVLGRWNIAPIGVLGIVLACGAWAAKVAESREHSMRNSLPDALQAMSSCFGAGYTLLQTFSHLADEMPGPLGRLFGIAAQGLKTGASPQRVLSQMQREGGMDEISFVSVALAVQHQTGGSMQHVLDATRASLKEELALRQSLQVHTAQAKLSARVVVGVTIGLVGIMMLLSPDFLSPFFTSFAGLCMLALAVVLQVGGIVSVRRLLRVGLG